MLLIVKGIDQCLNLCHIHSGIEDENIVTKHGIIVFCGVSWKVWIGIVFSLCCTDLNNKHKKAHQTSFDFNFHNHPLLDQPLSG